jgi:hypothetical protein
MMKTTHFNTNLFMLICLGLLLYAPSVLATTYYVDASKPAGGDGLSWATAFNNIQAGINAANPIWIVCLAPSDKVWVKQGTYNVTSEIVLGNPDPVYGGFPSSIANPVWEDRNPNSYPTIIDGGNTTRCVRISGYANLLDGFTIRNGSASTGAGIYIEAIPHDCGLSGYLSPYVQNCKIQYNTASVAGGGIYDTGSDAHIRYCEFSYNSSTVGGAIYQVNSGTEITRCNFHNNESTAPGSLGGGAVGGFSHNTTTAKYMSYTNCLFYSNHSESWGGAISGNQTYPIIKNCTFVANSANLNGGAFHGNTNSEAPKIWNCICWDNTPNELDIVTASGYLDVSYSDIEGGWAGAGSNNINADPDFVGGSDYHLQMGSPCIDTASNGYAPTDDLEGNPRPQDGDNNGTATADMGAYEQEYINVDLRVISIVLNPDIPRLNEPVTVTVTFRNYGTTDAGEFWLDWYANLASAPLAGAIGNRYERISGLAAGTTDTMVKTYTYTSVGDIAMYAQIDTNNEVTETNETNNVYGAVRARVVDGYMVDFNLKEENTNASKWFGGDDSTVRNVGVGQSVTLTKDARVRYAGFRFTQRFDYANNPEGVGHAVSLYLRVRQSDGTTLVTSLASVPSSFSGGWVKFYLGSNFWMNAGDTYILTCYLKDGEINELKSGVYGHSGDTWPTGDGYSCTQYGTPADMVTWANWAVHSWDFNLYLEGKYVDPYPADINNDRAVNLGDLTDLAANWLLDDCVLPGWCSGTDLNWSTEIQLEDLATMARYWDMTWYDYDDLNRTAIVSLYSQMSTSNIDASDGNEFNPGTYFIYRTSAGRYGKFIVENWQPGGTPANQLTIAWVTYNTSGTVYSSGTGLVIRGTYHCDLDLGLETSTNSDFWWSIYSSTTRHLQPENTARFKLMYRVP